MFGRDTYTPKPDTPFEPRPLRFTSIDKVILPSIILENGTEEPYHETDFWWTNRENTFTIEDIAALYQFQYGENLTYHTSSER